MSEHRQQWSGKTGGGNFGKQFLLFVLSRVKVVYLYPILYLIIPFYILFTPKSAYAVFRYFRQHQYFSTLKSLVAIMRNYFLFGQVVLDKFAILAGKAQQFHIDIEDKALIESLILQDKGFIIDSAHIGNFELLGYCFDNKNKKINALFFGGEDPLYQSYRLKSMKEANITPIAVSEDMSHLFSLYQALQNGELVTILSDRMMGNSKKVQLPFLAAPAHFPIGAFGFANSMNVTIIAVFIMKEKRQNYRGYIFPLSSPPSHCSKDEKNLFLAQQYVESLEVMVKKYPYQWFNFYDFWNIKNEK